MKLGPKVVAPAIVLAGGLIGSTALVLARPATPPREIVGREPVVRVIEARPETVTMRLSAHGSVAPRIETDLVAEVPGRIVRVAEQLEPGASFQAGDVLLEIEPRDYETALERAHASVERATGQKRLADSKLERARTLSDHGAASPAALDEAESNAQTARANLREAKAVRAQARLDLERTRLRAPFSGRVRTRVAQLGQFVGRGTPLARIYAIDSAEVRLALPNHELAFLEALGGDEQKAPPRVVLRGLLAGVDTEWEAELVRTEGVFDERTRMVHTVARVRQPEDGSDVGRLPVGLFVTGEIEGRSIEGVFELPRSALRPGDEVILVEPNGTLSHRQVKVLRADGDRVYVTEGLSAGDRVCITPPAMVVDGTQVRIAEEERS